MEEKGTKWMVHVVKLWSHETQSHPLDLVKKAFKRCSTWQYKEKLELNLQKGCLVPRPSLVPVIEIQSQRRPGNKTG